MSLFVHNKIAPIRPTAVCATSKGTSDAIVEKPAELNLADDGTNDEDPDVAGDGGVVLYLSKAAVMLMLEMAFVVLACSESERVQCLGSRPGH